MNSEQKLIEVMPEWLAEVHEMRIELKGMREDFNTRTDRLETVQFYQSSDIYINQ